MLYQAGDAYYNLHIATVKFNNYELSITYESQHWATENIYSGYGVGKKN
jgi:hypothetical protein